MNNLGILYHALARLETNTGIKGKMNAPLGHNEGELDLVWNGREFHAYFEIKRGIQGYQLPNILNQGKKFSPLMVIAENIYPNLKKALRENNIGYLDMAGNIYLPTQEKLLWIEGNKSEKPKRPVTNRAFTKTGLRTVFYLLNNPDGINRPYREIAKVTGVALGNINNIIKGLKDAGYLLEKGESQYVLINKKSLLERWLVAYQEILQPTLHLGSFRFLKTGKIQ